MKVNLTNWIEVARSKGFDINEFSSKFLRDDSYLTSEEIAQMFLKIENYQGKRGIK